MTRRWVKEELRKNPLQNIVLGAVDYYKENKSNVSVGFVILLVIGLFVGMALRNRSKETDQASKIFTFAQNDFDRFNYKEAIKKLNDIEKKFAHTKIMPHALYFKGLSYQKQGKLDEALKSLTKCIDEHPKSTIISLARLSLAAVHEELGNYEQALSQYGFIEDNDYLKPESLAGIARIYENTGKREEALDIYKRMQSHYINTFWGNFAENRLIAFGVKPVESDSRVEDIKFE